ncbi:transient receptor potential cation channel subfamily M member 6-like [Paramuricea clavata]|nr:transient receptor potential cation channel subfamily M member 6-like [Paramuricea clavata]
MMKLGKIVDSRKTTVVHMYTFDIDLMTWSKVAQTVEFLVEANPLGQGGFRSAYKATTHNAEFKKCSWVIKKYLPDAVETIQATNHSLEDHNKKVVQMHMLARNFALQLKQEILKDAGKAEQYGPHLKYRKIFLGKTDEGESLTVEEFVSGEFVKYINNNGIPCVSGNNVIGQKAQCLSHFSYERSGTKLMVVDIQGSSYQLYDPEIATSSLYDDSQFLFCTGNLAHIAIENFISKHKCTTFCTLAGLSPLSA